MKFKYIGQDNRFSPELIMYKLQENDYLKNGDIIDVPNKLKSIIKSLEISGLFVPVSESKSSKKGDKK